MEKKEGNSKKGRWNRYKMRKGYFFLLFTFSKPLKFVLGLPKIKMEIFYWEKAFHVGKKSGKMTLPPLKNIPLMLLHGLIPSNINHLRHKILTIPVANTASTHLFILPSTRTTASIRYTQDQFLSGMFYQMGSRWHKTYFYSA